MGRSGFRCRVLLIAVIGVVLVAIGAQLPEIERYLKVRVM